MYGRRVPRGLPRGPKCAGGLAPSSSHANDGGLTPPAPPRAALIGSAGLFLNEDEREAVVVELQGDGVGGGGDDLAAEVAESEGAS